MNVLIESLKRLVAVSLLAAAGAPLSGIRLRKCGKANTAVKTPAHKRLVPSVWRLRRKARAVQRPTNSAKTSVTYTEQATAVVNAKDAIMMLYIRCGPRSARHSNRNPVKQAISATTWCGTHST